jgi:hypothetical protein
VTCQQCSRFLKAADLCVNIVHDCVEVHAGDYRRPHGGRLKHYTVGEMPCAEYLRLHRLYQHAVRGWGQVEFLNLAKPEIRNQALLERNAAKERLHIHEKNCPTCDSRLRGISLIK